MIIIFEGCDGVGKTTAIETCKKIAEEHFGFSTRVVRRGPPTTRDWTELYIDTEDLEDDVDIIFCDRWHWGECVYGPIYRGEDQLRQGGREFVDTELARRDDGAMLILLDADDAAIEHRIRTRGDDFIEVDHTREILRRYRELYAMPTVLHTVKFDLGAGYLTHEDAFNIVAQAML